MTLFGLEILHQFKFSFTIFIVDLADSDIGTSGGKTKVFSQHMIFL